MAVDTQLEEITYSMLNEDEDLDNALEVEFAASSQRRSETFSLPAYSSEPRAPNGESGLLTFAFPGWGVDIFRDPMRKKPSIVRHELDKSLDPGLMENELDRLVEVKHGKCCWAAAERPGDGSSIYEMPNEIILNVMKRLSLRDLSSAIQSCQWWQRIGLQEDLWERFCQDVKDDAAAGFLPKWILIKNGMLLAQVKKKVTSRFAYFWKGFDCLRSMLRSWWETGRLNEQYNSKSLHSLIRKMTTHDWPVLYEFLGVVFSERADLVANILMKELAKAYRKNSKYVGEKICIAQGLETKTCNKGNEGLEPSYGSLAGKLDCGSQERLIGREMWKRVNSSWIQYKQWLLLISTHCPELNYEVLFERARSIAGSTTPTVYDKGVICFRGQVLLKYGLRGVLQSGFSWLTAQDSDETASELEVDLLRSIYHLLQEVDVLDDFLLSANLFTQGKLNRCFPVKRSYSRVMRF